jgi:hypothetical protein
MYLSIYIYHHAPLTPSTPALTRPEVTEPLSRNEGVHSTCPPSVLTGDSHLFAAVATKDLLLAARPEVTKPFFFALPPAPRHLAELRIDTALLPSPRSALKTCSASVAASSRPPPDARQQEDAARAVPLDPAPKALSPPSTASSSCPSPTSLQ